MKLFFGPSTEPLEASSPNLATYGWAQASMTRPNWPMTVEHATFCTRSRSQPRPNAAAGLAAGLQRYLRAAFSLFCLRGRLLCPRAPPEASHRLPSSTSTCSSSSKSAPPAARILTADLRRPSGLRDEVAQVCQQRVQAQCAAWTVCFCIERRQPGSCSAGLRVLAGSGRAACAALRSCMAAQPAARLTA